MSHEPRLQSRTAQPYIAIRTRAPITEIGQTCPPLIGELFAWMAEHGVTDVAPVFFRYVLIDMEGLMEIDVGIPIQEPLPVGDARVRVDVLPAGRYATLRHVGPYDGLMDATGRLLDWGGKQGLRWQASEDQRHWVARIEFYPTDPAEEPDSSKWVSELAFLTAPAE